MEIKFDRYTWRARVLPVYLTAAPAVLAIAATLPEGLNLPLGGASAVVFVPLSYFLSQIASDFGKRLEPALWKSWGGPPTTRFLRHDNDEFNPATRERVHERLRSLGLDIPTTDQEKADRPESLELYASAIDELRRLTRDTDRFPLVYKGNAEYGFRRNLLGLKTVGVTLTLAAIAGIGWAVLHEWRAVGVLAPVPAVISLLTACILLAWLVGVRPASVRITADRYARYLLEAALDLDPQ